MKNAEKPAKARSDAAAPSLPAWVSVAERPPESVEGRTVMLLFQRWERDFQSQDWYLTQWVRPLYANQEMAAFEKQALTAWCLLPPFPPLEKP